MNKIMQLSVLAALLYPLTSIADEANPLEQYLTPPYSKIVIGKKYDGEITGGLPKMKASTVLAVFNNCASDIKNASPSEINIKPILQPEKISRVMQISLDSSLTLIPSRVHIQQEQVTQKLKIQDDNSSILSSSNKSKLEIQLYKDVLGKATTHGLYETKTELLQSKKENVIVKINTLDSSHTTSSHTDAGASKVVFTELMLDKKGTQGIETAEHGNSLMADSVESIGISSFVSDKFTLSTHTDKLGGFKSEIDIDDADVPSNEFDTSLSGFYDTDDSQVSYSIDEMLSPHDQEELKFNVCTEAEFTKLFRKLTKKRTEQCTEEQCTEEPTLSIETNSFPAKLFHGHQAEIVVKVKNIGKSPAFNVLILTAIPENTNYLEFRGGTEAGKLYYELPAKSCNTIAIILRKPLFPGETFKANTFVKLAPWTVNN